MESVFERYVGICLRKALPAGVDLISTAATQYLCSHRAQPLFQLKPDFVVKSRDQAWVLDTKWKLIDRSQSSSQDKYGLSQSDFYQLYAYGQKYLSGRGDMFLVFPRTAQFDQALPPFLLESDLRLWVVPFAVQRGELDLQGMPGNSIHPFVMAAIAA